MFYVIFLYIASIIYIIFNFNRHGTNRRSMGTNCNYIPVPVTTILSATIKYLLNIFVEI